VLSFGFIPVTSISSPVHARSRNARQLPPNVHLATLQDNSLFGGEGAMLLRFAHLFAVGEDPVLSKPATVTLSTLFTSLAVTDCVETSLTANQEARLPDPCGYSKFLFFCVSLS
jgi:hypothetical protein